MFRTLKHKRKTSLILDIAEGKIRRFLSATVRSWDIVGYYNIIF